MELDLSALDDDQLIALAQTCCREAVSRNPAVAHAMRDMMLSEAERARIARSASDLEIAAQRARERAEIAAVAREQARAAAEAESAARRAAVAADAARADRARAEAAAAAMRVHLQRAADLVGIPAVDLSILYVDTRYGRRVMINRGADRYAADHLADYKTGTGAISTSRDLVKQKPALIEALSIVARSVPVGTHIVGSHYTWSTS